MSRKKQEQLFWGVVLLIVGALFMLDNFGVDIDLWDIIGEFWPLILIGIGLKNIWYYYSTRRKRQEQEER
jgi:lia operon protein LiaF